MKEKFWYNIAMSYEEAIKKAEENAKFFPCGKEEGGREWIEVEGKRYPKDWFIQHAARMMAGGELG